MARRGPKKKPLAIIKLHGSRHLYRRKDKDAGLKIESSIPTPPDWLQGEARLEWDRITSKLAELGILTELDRAIVVTYCQTWADYVEALAYCRKLLIKTTAGNIIQNPAIGIKNRAHQLLLRAAVELGMSPSSRAGINVPKVDNQDEAKRFFQKELL